MKLCSATQVEVEYAERMINVAKIRRIGTPSSAVNTECSSYSVT